MTRSAPARRMAVSASRTAARSSKAPAAAAACSMAYSPLTQYAASGRSVMSRTRATTSRAVSAGLTMTMSAPSSMSSRTSRTASRWLDVHLVAVPVTGARRAVRRLAEGSVHHRSVFGAVGEHGGVVEAAVVERRPDRANLAVHHAAGGDDVRAGGRLRHGDAAVQLDGGVVVDAAVLAEHSAVAVVGVLVKTAVGDEHAVVAVAAAEAAQRALDDAVLGPRL